MQIRWRYEHSSGISVLLSLEAIEKPRHSAYFAEFCDLEFGQADGGGRYARAISHLTS